MKNSRVSTLFMTAVLLPFATLTPPHASAQTMTPTTINDSNRSGPLPFSSSVGTAVEQVDLASGTLNVTIPLFSTPGRHLGTGVTLYYSSNVFNVNTLYDGEGDVTSQLWALQTNSGWTDNNPTGTSSYLQVNCRPVLHSPPTVATYITNVVYTDTSHAQHTLTAQDAVGSSPCQNPSDAGPDTGAQGLWAANTMSVKHSDGSTMDLSAFKLTDSNGNYENLPGTFSGNPTDTFGRNGYTSTTAPDRSTLTYHVYDSNGTLQDYVVHWIDIPLSTSFGTGANEINSTTYTPAPAQRVISEIDIPSLPYGKRYLFTYEPNYGLLNSITLPDGGVIQYTYSNYTDTSDLYNTGTRRYVSTRTETVNGASASWQINIPNSQGNNVSAKTTTVTFPDAMSHQQVLTAQNGAITDTKIYSGAVGGTPLREYSVQYTNDVDPTFDTCYRQYATGEIPFGQAVGIRPIQITSTLENGMSSIKTYTYDSFTFTRHWRHCNVPSAAQTFTSSRGNVLEVKEYDWAPTGTTGALLRRMTHTYFNDTASNASAYVAANIVDKIASTNLYDGSGNLIAQTNYTYDDYSSGNGSSLAATASVPSHDYSGYSTANTIRGNLTQINRWLNTGSGSFLRTSSGYDDLGNVVSQIDPMSHQTTWSYADSWSSGSCAPTGNSHAYPTSVTVAAGTAVAETSQTAYYPCTGLPSSIKNPNDIANSRPGTQWAYDSIGRPTSQTFPDLGSMAMSYADFNSVSNSNPTRVTTVRQISASPALAMTTVSEMDGLSRARKSWNYTNATTKIYSRTLFDSIGRVSQRWNPSYCDPDSVTSCTADNGTFGYTSSVYDALGRQTILVPPDGTLTSNNVTTTFSGTSSTTVDQALSVRTATVDGLGRLAQVSEGSAGYITQYSYDTLGNLLCVEQHGGVTGTGCSSDPANDNTSPWRVRRFGYDSLSRLMTSRNPEAGPITYAYDNDGNVISKTDARGIVVTYSPSGSPIDALGRMTQKTYSDSTPSVSYTYDVGSNGIGRRTGMTDGSGSASWTYDAMGRALSEQRTIGSAPGVTKAIGTQYYLDGSVKTVTYPSGNVVTVTPGDHGLPVSVTDSGHSYASSLAYGPTGMLTSATYGLAGSFTGIIQANSYNKRLQLSAVSAVSPSATLMNLSYDFGLGTSDNGDVYHIYNAKVTDHSRDQTFTYDGLNRLNTARSGTWGIQFAVDAWGNQMATSGIAGTSLVNAMPTPVDLGANLQNQATSSLVTYSYTGGNMTANGSNSYAYDGEDRVTTAGGVTYTYDGDGKRVKKSSGTLYWGSGPLAESDASGTITNEYIFVNGKRVARRDGSGNVIYYVSDHLGSSNVVVNSAGVLQNESDFYPFGGENSISSSLTQNYKFTGKERDAESGLDYFGARMYASSIGRFMSPDWSAKAEPIPYAKLGDPQSLNLYTYVGNNPLSELDPDGHSPIDCSGGNASGVGCQTIAGWNTQHEVSAGAWNASGFGEPGQKAQQQSSSTTTVTVNNRQANIPGGGVLDALGIDHQWISTPDGVTVGMGTAQGVPQSDAPGVQTQVVDHTGQVATSTQTFTGVDKAALSTYTQVGTPTGRWLPGVNDCNTWVQNVVSQSTPHNIYDRAPIVTRNGVIPGHIEYHNVVVYANGSIHSPGGQ